MWRHWLTGLVAWLALAAHAFALSPYVGGDRLSSASLAATAALIEGKLRNEGFKPVGRFFPKGLPGYGVVIATSPSLQAMAAAAGRHAILASVVRVGFQNTGAVSWTNPEYWGRAYLRGDYDAHEATFDKVRVALAAALGEGKPFGGDVAAKNLAGYRYMIGMEKLDTAKGRLTKADSFVDAVRVVREQLANGTENTAKVYEVVLPDAKLAVFGVALNDETRGDAAWLTRIGMQEGIAGLPYEIYVVGNEIYSPFARFRVALAYPAVGMGQFMRISSMPAYVLDTLRAVAGVERQPDAWR